MRLMTLEGSRSFGALDLLALLLLLQQFLQCVLVAVLEFLGIEVSLLGLDDVGREIEHVLRDLLVFDIVEIVLLVCGLRTGSAA